MIQNYNEENKERAFLISLDCGEYDAESSMAELEELAKTSGAEIIGEMIQKRPAPEAATYMGKGALEEICNFCSNHNIDLIIADGELSPVQIRNIEDLTGVRVIDRTTLILDIFAGRARSSEGKLQVELAQLKYSLPRLSGAAPFGQRYCAVATRRRNRHKRPGRNKTRNRQAAYPFQNTKP